MPPTFSLICWGSGGGGYGGGGGSGGGGVSYGGADVVNGADGVVNGADDGGGVGGVEWGGFLIGNIIYYTDRHQAKEFNTMGYIEPLKLVFTFTHMKNYEYEIVPIHIRNEKSQH